MEYRIFYSWQSDSPNSTNRAFIQEALEGAIAELKADATIVVDPVIDRDTAGVAGSPDIGITIFGKIDAAAVFVSDVSIVTQLSDGGRQAPNPNVLVELGYALKALGYGKTIMVMNTISGEPESLPFDLKQKRVVTYSLSKGEDKVAARKLLRGKLWAALREIVREHQAAAPQPPAGQVSAEVVIEAIRGSRPDQAPLVTRFSEWLTDEIKKLDRRGQPGIEDDALVQAIGETSPLVDEFGRVAQAAAEMNSSESARALFVGLERVLALYDIPRGFTGSSFRDWDFDLYKFVGHEVCTVLFASFLRAGRWALIDEIANEKLYQDPPSGHAGHVGVEAMSESLKLLEIRSRKTRTISAHGDLLKERHERAGPVGGVPWEVFRAADLLLFLRTYRLGEGWQFPWYPRTVPHVLSPPPRFLVDAATPLGSKNLAIMLGEPDRAILRARVKGGLGYLREGLAQMGAYRPRDRFDADQIAG